MDDEEIDYLKQRLEEALVSKYFYLSEICERNYKNRNITLMKYYLKTARFVKTATRAISYAATFTQATGCTVRGMKNVWKNIKDRNFFTKQNAAEMAGLATNTFTALHKNNGGYLNI